jgi:hypothetical protein
MQQNHQVLTNQPLVAVKLKLTYACPFGAGAPGETLNVPEHLAKTLCEADPPIGELVPVAPPAGETLEASSEENTSKESTSDLSTGDAGVQNPSDSGQQNNPPSTSTSAEDADAQGVPANTSGEPALDAAPPASTSPPAGGSPPSGGRPPLKLPKNK